MDLTDKGRLLVRAWKSGDDPSALEVRGTRGRRRTVRDEAPREPRPALGGVTERHYYQAERRALAGVCEGSGGFSEGNDGTFAFRTPLATLHKFNGWAEDAFLVTPAIGLEDLYVFVGATLPWQIKSKLVFHWFLRA